MMLRDLYKDSNYDWIAKAKALERKAEKFAPNLFLFDNFVEKEIEDLENASDQLIYTYTIINLYGLFFDSGKYIANQKGQGVFQTNIGADFTLISNFYGGLQELRSIICHNKPLDSIKYNNLDLLGKNLDLSGKKRLWN